MLLNQASKRNSQSGFTIVEMVVVLVLFSILALTSTMAIPKYLVARRDAQRKADLAGLKHTFESYAGDEGCYPPAGLLQTCGSTSLAPYMRKVPCDPLTNQPYLYERSAECNSYELYANLENEDDDKITELGCENGCGPGGAYNYGIVGGGAVLEK